MERIAECDLNTVFGLFHEVLYSDGNLEVIAFVMGDPSEQENVLCRLHSSCIHGHYFNSVECDCREQMAAAQVMIQKEGMGIILLLDQEGKGNGHYGLLKSIEYKRKGMNQAEAYEAAGFKRDARDFSQAAFVLKDLGVGSIRLMTDNRNKLETLRNLGVNVEGTVLLKIEK